MKYDLAISYTWIYDIEFTQLIEKLFQENRLTTFIINRANIDEVTELVKENKLFFKAYLDRASDVDDNFTEIVNLLTALGCRIINPHHNTLSATDKSIVQQKLIENGLKLPKTIIVPPYDIKPGLDFSDEIFNHIGSPFIIKPAYYSGGGEGVKKSASSFEEIEIARKENSDDSYLLQEKIHPVSRNGHRAWFRVLWAFGKIIPMLWDDEKLFYSDDEVGNIFPDVLQRINLYMNKIFEVAQLDYFSSEFALTDDNELFLIDYVNDQCDMRLKSNHPDGVPDKIVIQFVEELMRFVRNANPLQ